MVSDREYFNNRAKDWDITCVHDQKKVDYIIQLVDIKSSDKVLDVGTGTGVLIPHIIKRLDQTGHVFGIDVSEKMLEVAESKYFGEQITYYHKDIFEITSENTFDIIICYSMFPHFKERKLEAIQHMSRLLKIGGKLCIAHSQSRDCINRLHLEIGEEVKNDRLPEMSILKEVFNNNGLQINHILDDDAFFFILGSRDIDLNKSLK
jgi:ubiquinone/menaquinone biosynthesis C-methylase UbiE